MKVGDRVRIYIYNPGKWVQTSVECLNGKTGIIKEVKEPNWFSDNNFLVEFDTPAKTWHSYQTPWSAAWFCEADLLHTAFQEKEEEI